MVPCKNFVLKVIKIGIEQNALRARKIYSFNEKMKRSYPQDKELIDLCNKENEIDLQNLNKFCKEKNETLKEFVFEDDIVSDFIFNALKYNLKDSYNKKGILKKVFNSNHVIYNIMKNVDLFNKSEVEKGLKNIYEYI